MLKEGSPNKNESTEGTTENGLEGAPGFDGRVELNQINQEICLKLASMGGWLIEMYSHSYSHILQMRCSVFFNKIIYTFL